MSPYSMCVNYLSINIFRRLCEAIETPTNMQWFQNFAIYPAAKAVKHEPIPDMN